MRVSQSSSFKAEDYQSERTWIGRFFLPLNRLLQEMVGVINGGLTPEDNSKSILKTVSGRVGLPLAFEWPYPLVPPVSAVVCRASQNQTAKALGLAWEYRDGTVTVTKLVDLETNQSIAGQSNWTVIIRCSV